MRRLLTDRQLGATLAIGCSSGRRPLAAVFVTATLLLAASVALAAEPESLAPPPCETGQSSVVIAVPGPLDTPSQSLGDRCALSAEFVLFAEGVPVLHIPLVFLHRVYDHLPPPYQPMPAVGGFDG